MINLSKVTQSIVFGNGEVWNFLDYAVNRELGGLLSYTQKNDYLGKNFINNFDGGFKRSYEYSDINNTEGYAIDRVWGGLRGSPHGFGGNMGELYEVPETFNSELKFITKDERLDIQNLILKKHLSKKKLDNNALASIVSYAGEINDAWKDTNLSDLQMGELVNFYEEKPNITKYTLDEVADSVGKFRSLMNTKVEVGKGTDVANDEIYKGFSVSSAHPISQYNITTKVNDRTFVRLASLDDVASIQRENLNYTIGDEYTKYASKLITLNDNVTWNSERFNIFDVNEKKHLSLKSDVYISLQKRGGVYREYISNLKGIKAPWTDDGLAWGYKNSYGVSYKEKGVEEYIVGGENNFNGDININPEFNGGWQIKYNAKEKTTAYNYFQEKEGDGNPSLKSTSVVDGSSVSLFDYNGASRLLKKTNEYFKEGRIKTLINRFHSDKIEEGEDMISSYDEKYGLSRGRNLLSKDSKGNVIVDKSSGYDNPYCRSWTAHHQYSKLRDRIRPFFQDGSFVSLKETQSRYDTLRPNNGADYLNTHSVLGSNGYVNITPTNGNNSIKNFMFSIENLAWRDIKKDVLSKEQQGPSGGRIMWFPPYNLKFSENVNVNWNANSFIGRGEDIYTYTNTNRSGTLDFTLLIDHPSILNKWVGICPTDGDGKKDREEELLRFFAGCGNLNNSLPPVEEKTNEPEEIEEAPSTTPTPKSDTKKIAYVMFFPNLYSGSNNIKTNIEKTITDLSGYNKGGAFSERDNDFNKQNVGEHNKVSNGLTSEDYDVNLIRNTLFEGNEKVEIKFFEDLLKIEENIKGDEIFGFKGGKCEITTIEVKGFASSHGSTSTNNALIKRRRETIKMIMKHVSPYFSTMEYRDNSKGGIIKITDVDSKGNVNDKSAKIARAAYAIVEIKWSEENVATPTVNEEAESTVNGAEVDVVEETKEETVENTKSQTVKTLIEGEYTYDNEYLYFSKAINDSLIQKNIIDKVRYFDPAFHSVTPEGFNARLTFLHQCTRQGPTDMGSSGSKYVDFAGNLAFGRAPYCILRIGDFFNTKICIDSVSITYDNNGVQWDLNPEGIGVQPMYANISISFKFIGGQDISKPIERLQNAVTANYYANASVYSRHADNGQQYYDATDGSYHSK